MTIFTHAITFREWVTAYLLRGKRHYDSAELENLSDRSLEDIGLEVRKRDFGTGYCCFSGDTMRLIGKTLRINPNSLDVRLENRTHNSSEDEGHE
jgi:hypothetical protein